MVFLRYDSAVCDWSACNCGGLARCMASAARTQLERDAAAGVDPGPDGVFPNLASERLSVPDPYCARIGGACRTGNRAVAGWSKHQTWQIALGRCLAARAGSCGSGG